MLVIEDLHRVSRVDAGTAGPSGEPDALVTRVRAGDQPALEILFRAHYSALCDFAARYVRQDALAEELVQDLFADLWARRQSWHVRGPVRAYLFAAVRNRALNLRQRQSIERDWEQDEALADVRELHQPPESADQALERADLRARLDAALESLPERCRLVMHLRWREQMRHAEIASVMGISVKGVEIQLARGLRAIRAMVSF
jgi:RNA polymerase sigma-70 factor, ECF subfamily